jgi:hypothetical protein
MLTQGDTEATDFSVGQAIVAIYAAAGKVVSVLLSALAHPTE